MNAKAKTTGEVTQVNERPKKGNKNVRFYYSAISLKTKPIL